MAYRKIKTCLFIAFLLFFLPFTSNNAFASENKKDFDAGSYIIDHVVDSYGWHITTIGGHAISIPLPIILFDNGKFICFMSNKLHHGEAAYKGYALGFTPETEKQIVKLTEPVTGHLHEVPQIDSQAKIIDISITKNVCSLLIGICLLAWIFISIAKSYKRRENMAPKGLQSFLEPVILFVRDEVAIPSIGKKKYEKYFPYLLTLFFFILINNLMGLIPLFPGGANVTGNIAITGILALITFFITTFSSNKNYWKHIFNTPGVPWWLKFPVPLMPLVEFIGVFTKPFTLMIRLFANITAGHIMILGFIGLIFIIGEMNTGFGFAVAPVSLFFYLFMGLIELLVAFIQAFVFTLLTAIYIGMATEEHHTEEHTTVHELTQTKE